MNNIISSDCKGILRALNSLESSLCGYSGDISADRRLKWIYGILIGLNADSLKEFSERHNIKMCDIARLKDYRNSYLLLRKELEKGAKK